jgi:hypothetical protein
MTKKLRDRSQFYPDFNKLVDEVVFHSQIGEFYKLAELGSLDEVYERLGKYDKMDLPLDLEMATKAISYFVDKIGNCDVIEFDGAYSYMDKTKSIGFGAQTKGIFSREDPLMKRYLQDYIDVCSKELTHVVINAAQKDEVRVSTKTPRLFTSFPPEHTFVATMLLGDFMDQWVENRFTTTGNINSVGDSIQNGAAALYFEELDKRPFKYCTDTSAQDASVSPVFIDMCYSAIKLKYQLTPEEDMMFENLRFNSINKLMNVNGDLYMVSRGLGSGDYLTIVINIMWRYFLFLTSYNHDIKKVEEENTVIICGDDFICSSEHSDLNHDSKYAGIDWAHQPVEWEDMDFCSIKFKPYIHHDPNKVHAVLSLRKKKQHMLSPEHEMQRLGGILRVLSDYETYEHILHLMYVLMQKCPETTFAYMSLFITYEELFSNYNDYLGPT